MLSIAAFICSVFIDHIPWFKFVTITGFVIVALSFTVHALNYFPDEAVYLIIVSVSLM